MKIRADLYMKQEDRDQLQGNGPVDLWMPHGLKCKLARGSQAKLVGEATYGLGRTRELAGGRIVCMACEHGPCQVPDGIGRDRELHIHRESK